MPSMTRVLQMMKDGVSLFQRWRALSTNIPLVSTQLSCCSRALPAPTGPLSQHDEKFRIVILRRKSIEVTRARVVLLPCVAWLPCLVAYRRSMSSNNLLSETTNKSFMFTVLEC